MTSCPVWLPWQLKVATSSDCRIFQLGKTHRYYNWKSGLNNITKAGQSDRSNRVKAFGFYLFVIVPFILYVHYKIIQCYFSFSFCLR
jgi:hypothetical protein